MTPLTPQQRKANAFARRVLRDTQIMLAYYDGFGSREIAAKHKLSQRRVNQIIQAARPIYEGMHS